MQILQDEQSWADDAGAVTPKRRAASVDPIPIPEQQQLAADHIQECPPHLQLPPPDEREAQQPGQQVQQHDPMQQPLQQWQERLQPEQQQQRTSLRHDAPSWDTRARAIPASGEQACILACCDGRVTDFVIPIISTRSNQVQNGL